jgi:chromosome segregation ATPase
MMTLSNLVVVGQDGKSACEKLVEKMELEAKNYEKQIDELTKELKTIREKCREDSADLQKTKELLSKEQTDRRKEQIKQQDKRIKQLQKDSVALSKTIIAIAAEKDRLKNAESERTHIQKSYDSIVKVLNNVRSQWAKDTAKISRLYDAETERNSLKTINTNLTTELKEARLQRKQDSVEIVRLCAVEIELNNLNEVNGNLSKELNEAREQWNKDTMKLRESNILCQKNQTDLELKLSGIEKNKNDIENKYNSISGILSNLRDSLIVETAKSMLDKAYNKSEIDKSIVSLSKISPSSPAYKDVNTTRNVLNGYAGKWAKFEEIIKSVKFVDSKSQETSKIMQAQHLQDIYSFIKNGKDDAFRDFKDYPFLTRKLQELLVIKIEDVHKDISNILKQ